MNRSIIDYRVIGDTCVFTCGKNIIIDDSFASKMVRLKNIYQSKHNITKFVVIINWSYVKTKDLDVSSFAEDDSLEGVYSIALVNFTENYIKRFFYILSCVMVNYLICIIKTKGIKIKFFTNIKKAIVWSNEI